MTQELISQIPLDQLHESPFNHRTVYKGLNELAANILSEGRIHEPLLVRPRLTNPLRDDLQEGFEIVFGHRRFRAAEIAGLATVPCMVRAMSTAEARSAQAAENLQRDNVTALEEARLYQDMIDSDKLTGKEVAARVGRSESHVSARITLLGVLPEIREALAAGAISADVAVLIARLRTPKLQMRGLADVRADTSSASKLDDGGKRSYRHIRDHLAERYTLSLKDAIFAPEDATLLPDAGTCSACPKRVGNAPEFEDLASPSRDSEHLHHYKGGGPNVCTDPDCWAAKKAAHLAREAAALQADGKVVITGNKARQSLGARGEVKGAYVDLDKVKQTLKKLPKTAPAPKVVEIQDQRTGKLVKAVARADLVAAGAMTAEEAKKPTDSHAQQQVARERERQAEQAKLKAENGRRMALLLHVRQVAASRERDAFDLRLLTSAALAGVQYEDKDVVAKLHGAKDVDTLKRAIDSMSMQQLTQLLLDCAMVDNVQCQYFYNRHSQPEPLLAIAAHYGVDAKAVMDAWTTNTEPASTPSTAGASAKKAATAPAAPGRGVKYRCPMTLQTWSGRGLRPAWINAAIAGGKSLADFEVKEVKKVKVDAGSAGEHAQADLLAEAGV